MTAFGPVSTVPRQPHGPPTILLRFDAPARRAAVAGTADGTPPNQTAPLCALADSLAGDLERLCSTPAPIPSRKARLTRIGGRCPTHGSLLEFDPFQPHTHWCARCSQAYHAKEHDDWWAMNAQLWTAERAVHAAALYTLRGDPRHATITADILRRYTDQYQRWPNVDNVLGPSRPFFSTYLESIWLLNICHAVALLEGTTEQWSIEDASQLRERVIEPSALLIDGFHEGRSNRQVWNEVAICSAWTMLGRTDAARHRLHSSHGIRGLVDVGLDADGFWYEGENYHLFAHRGLWYGVELMRALDAPLPAELDARYAAGFLAPFRGLLPDETFPSRRDAQYGSSIRQWRTAEWCELGWAHASDPRSAVLLQALYDSRTPRLDTGRAQSTADAERNTAPTALTRADLSWRALLMAELHIPRASHRPAESSCLPSQGLAVIRRDEGRTYVALEGGESGGGHGHPDQLALTLQTSEARWLDDPGTGSYVEPRLAWYRSTLAHYAPLFDRQTQSTSEARLVAFEARDAFGWIVKRVEEIASGIVAERAVLVADGYLVDVLEWECARETELTLPIAGSATFSSPNGSDVLVPPSVDAVEADGPVDEDPGFGFLRDLACLANGTEFALIAAPSFARTTTPRDEAAMDIRTNASMARAHLWYITSHPAKLHGAIAPAAPGHGETARHWLTTRAARGRVVGVWSWPTAHRGVGAVDAVSLTADGSCSAKISLSDGTRDEHHYKNGSWRVETLRHGVVERTVFETAASSSRTGDGLVSADAGQAPSSVLDTRQILRVPQIDDVALNSAPGTPLATALEVVLSEQHYVRTEPSWRDAGSPTARVQLMTTSDAFVVDVHVDTGPPVSSSVFRENPLDNELHDINADGIQWYFADAAAAPIPGSEWLAAGLVVPVVDERHGLVCRPSTLAGSDLAPRVHARTTSRGWAMRLIWDRSALPIGGRESVRFELVVNERPPERERRRGQLVLSGGGGFGYLAGSRRSPDRSVRLVFGNSGETGSTTTQRTV